MSWPPFLPHGAVGSRRTQALNASSVSYRARELSGLSQRCLNLNANAEQHHPLLGDRRTCCIFLNTKGLQAGRIINLGFNSGNSR